MKEIETNESSCEKYYGKITPPLGRFKVYTENKN